MASRLTLVLGGVRSGKSTHALSLAEASGLPITFLASGAATDSEMERRIANHKEGRPDGWSVVECGSEPGPGLRDADTRSGLIVLDCATMLISRWLDEHEMAGDLIEADVESDLKTRLDELVGAIRAVKSPVIVVANEVGMGVVPPYPSGRLFRDLAGQANRRLAAEADEVVMMVAGLPIRLKTED